MSSNKSKNRIFFTKRLMKKIFTKYIYTVKSMIFLSVILHIVSIWIVALALSILFASNSIMSVLLFNLLIVQVVSMLMLFELHFLAAVIMVVYISAMTIFFVFIVMITDTYKSRGIELNRNIVLFAGLLLWLFMIITSFITVYAYANGVSTETPFPLGTIISDLLTNRLIPSIGYLLSVKYFWVTISIFVLFLAIIIILVAFRDRP
jgi:NADH:ubiquinone oxidoreductase subunit 6 (subunit J)